jgi:hypothetical protein
MLLAACGQSNVEPQIQMDNIGTVCLFGGSNSFDPPQAQGFRADSPVYLSFRIADVCLESGCFRDLVASCSVIQNGTSLGVRSSASWIDTRSTNSSCFSDCWIPTATCATEVLPIGSYTIVFGTHTLALDVPSQVPSAPCATN